MNWIISDNIPVPPDCKTGPDKYPFPQMEVGQSVFFEGARAGGKEYLAAQVVGYQKGWKFVSRKEGCGLRIWRAEKTEPDATGGQGDNPLAARVKSLVSGARGQTLGVIKNRLRPIPGALVESLINSMVDKGALRSVEEKHKFNGRTINRYFLNDT